MVRRRRINTIVRNEEVPTAPFKACDTCVFGVSYLYNPTSHDYSAQNAGTISKFGGDSEERKASILSLCMVRSLPR
jgi:hypothetical protein